MKSSSFDNRFLQELAADPNTQNTPRQVFGAIWSSVTPEPSPQPEWIAVSTEVCGLLGLSSEQVHQQDWLQALSGGTLIEGMQSYATCYGGHQFGNWAGQLGDGRAIYLGEWLQAGNRYELQLKGAGKTPYSRHADGKAVLRSSIREFLCSEAMHHLGVPTTRALSLIRTGEPIWRDMFYDGRPEQEPGAIVCRVSPSFTRFGHFQLPAMRGETELLNQLIDFTIDRDFPHLAALPKEQQREAWFREICRKTASLVVEWMRVGFVHGVMNTDNMSILGLTIDYGPYGWIDNFDLYWTPNTTDAEGLRYCFGRQPAIARWNLYRLAEALGTVMTDLDMLKSALQDFDTSFAALMGEMLAAKLGFQDWQESDGELTDALFALMTESEVDMTIFYRRLADLDVSCPEFSVLHDAFYDEAKIEQYRERWDQWLSSYCQRVLSSPFTVDERRASMNRVNPCYVLRNYLSQQAIDAATVGDYQPLHQLMEVMKHPYDERAEWAEYAKKRPAWAKQKAGCSMLSCSS